MRKGLGFSLGSSLDALSPGAQGGNGQFTVEAEYGESLTLTSTPYGGRHPKWRGTQYAGYRYGSNVTVKVTGTLGLEAEFDDQAPNLIYGMSMNIAAGAAHISCAFDDETYRQGGSYDHAEAAGPVNRFAYTVNQTPGYSFNYVTWFAGGADRYTTQSNISGRPGRDYSVYLTSNVNLIVETEGQGVVTSPHFKAGYNPRPYEQALYTQPAPTSLTPITNGNPVMMTPVPCPGWAFDHWEYKNANNEWVAVENPIPGNPIPITVYMNWWTGAGIHVPENQSGLPVKAVFTKTCLCGPACYPSGSNLTIQDTALIQSHFPNIRLCNVYKTDNATGPAPNPYNCVAFVGRQLDRWVWAEIDQPVEAGGYGNGNNLWERHEFVNYFNDREVTDYIIYGFSYSDVQHAARFDGTCAESKCGGNIRIRHDAVEMEGGYYGYILPE